MKAPIHRLLFWTPRVLAVLFAAFVSVFALDVFSEGLDFWKAVLAFAIHLTAAGIILVALAIAWRWEGIGGLLFIALGVLYLARTRLAWFTSVLFLAGGLFLLSWLFSKTKNDQKQTDGSAL